MYDVQEGIETDKYFKLKNELLFLSLDLLKCSILVTEFLNLEYDVVNIELIN